MVRQTSIESYVQLKKDNILGVQQQLVMDALKVLKIASDSEIARHLRYDDINKVRPRRFELVDLGCVEEAGKDLCSVTGRKVIKWKLVNDKILKKQMLKTELTLREITRLLKMIDEASPQQKMKLKNYIMLGEY